MTDPPVIEERHWLCPRCGRTGIGEEDRCPDDRTRVIEDARGRTIDGRYVIEELLGVGGMGSAVWRAHQESTRRHVAIKLLPPADPEAIRRFERGARIASNLNHAHIVTVHDYGRTDSGALFLVMELLHGRELNQVIKRRGRLGSVQVMHLADQALQALSHAHRKRVVHRDLKPGNLFLVDDEDDLPTLKILDFGIARFFDDDDPEDGDLAERVDADVTTEHKICGTPRYMAPEQIIRGPIDGRTDLYALGIVLYRCLTGHTPFDGDMTTLMYSHLHTPVPALRDRVPDIDPLLESVVLKALAKRPGDRFGTARAMRETLFDVQQEMGLGVMRPPTTGDISRAVPLAVGPAVEPETPRRRWPWLLALGLLVGLGATFAMAVADRGPIVTSTPAVGGAGPVKATIAADADLPVVVLTPLPIDAGAADMAPDAGVTDAAPDAAVDATPDAAPARRRTKRRRPRRPAPLPIRPEPARPKPVPDAGTTPPPRIAPRPRPPAGPRVAPLDPTTGPRPRIQPIGPGGG